MTKRGVTKSDVKEVLQANGCVDVPGNPEGTRKRWTQVNGRTVKVFYFEGTSVFTIQSACIKDN